MPRGGSPRVSCPEKACTFIVELWVNYSCIEGDTSSLFQIEILPMNKL
jgi:hypothetical protein